MDDILSIKFINKMNLDLDCLNFKNFNKRD